jgi:hypothetical protein
VQARCRPSEATGVGNGGKGPEVPKVHSRS